MVLNLNDMAVVISWSHKSRSHANFEIGIAMGSAKQSEQEPKRRYDFPCFIRPTITPAPWKSHRQHLGRTADVYCLQVRVLPFIVRFYSRGRQLCKFIATKESLDQLRLLGNCPTTPPLVSLAAVFWMSRSPTLRGGALRDILTAARETTGTPHLTHVEKYIKTSYLASLLLLREQA